MFGLILLNGEERGFKTLKFVGIAGRTFLRLPEDFASYFQFHWRRNTCAEEEIMSAVYGKETVFVFDAIRS